MDVDDQESPPIIPRTNRGEARSMHDQSFRMYSDNQQVIPSRNNTGIPYRRIPALNFSLPLISPERQIQHVANNIIGAARSPPANNQNQQRRSSLQSTNRRRPLEDPEVPLAKCRNNGRIIAAITRPEEQLLSHHQAVQSSQPNRYDPQRQGVVDTVNQNLLQEYGDVDMGGVENIWADPANLVQLPPQNPLRNPLQNLEPWELPHLNSAETLSQNLPVSGSFCTETKPSWGPDGGRWVPAVPRGIHRTRPPPSAPRRVTCRNFPTKACDHLIDDRDTCLPCHTEQTRATMERRLQVRNPNTGRGTE